MADNPISEYQAKLKELHETTQAVEKMVATIVSGANKLTHWRQVVVTDGGNFPCELMGGSQTINANDWPTGQQIGQLLSQWHSLHSATQQAYEQIPDDQRDVVQPPPD